MDRERYALAGRKGSLEGVETILEAKVGFYVRGISERAIVKGMLPKVSNMRARLFDDCFKQKHSKVKAEFHEQFAINQRFELLIRFRFAIRQARLVS